MCFLQIVTNTALSEGMLIPVISSVWFNAMVPDFNAKHDMYSVGRRVSATLWDQGKSHESQSSKES